MEIKNIVEAILFAADKPLRVNQLRNLFPELERPDSLDIQEAIDAIRRDYRERPVELRQVASGYRFQIREGLSPWVSRLFEEKPPKYTRAFLETLAIIAYRQPVTRGDIEEIRGVGVSSTIIHSLMDREWIRVIAHKEVPGRPAIFGTTKQFLDYFNLVSLDELPTLQELQEFDVANEVEDLAETQNLEADDVEIQQQQAQSEETES
jgi:segregation and condensation protein B